MVVVVNEVNEGDRISWLGGIVDSWNDESILVGNESTGRVLLWVSLVLHRRWNEEKKRSKDKMKEA